MANENHAAVELMYAATLNRMKPQGSNLTPKKKKRKKPKKQK